LQDYKAALAESDAALAADPRCPELHYNRGRALAGLERYPEALAAFDDAIRLRDDYVEPLVAAGEILLEAARDGVVDPGAATERFRRASELDPTRSSVLVLWGDALMLEGKFEQARWRYYEAIQLD
jgi:Flp pilus assembly protein TadD